MKSTMTLYQQQHGNKIKLCEITPLVTQLCCNRISLRKPYMGFLKDKQNNHQKICAKKIILIGMTSTDKNIQIIYGIKKVSLKNFIVQKKKKKKKKSQTKFKKSKNLVHNFRKLYPLQNLFECSSKLKKKAKSE